MWIKNAMLLRLVMALQDAEGIWNQSSDLLGSAIRATMGAYLEILVP